jgi:tetratricopeptide (TPR) repeat protein
MKRLAIGWTAALAMVLLLAGSLHASTTARTFITGIEAYRAGNFAAAIDAFETVAAAGVDNGQLYYNLGNAYLKNGDVGHAVLWYERALKRIPDDPDLRFNHDYALTLTKDERGMRTSPLLQILFFWKYQLSDATVRWIALGLNMVLWIALTVLAFRAKRLLRPGIVVTAAGAVIFTATAVYNYVETVQVRHAVILPEKVSVRSGFSDTATQLFVLHAGTKVRVSRETDTHLMVRYTADKIGWVAKADVGMI